MIHLLLGVVVAIAVLTPLGGRAHRKTEQGNRQYLQEQYEDALRSYTEAQEELPDAPQLYYDIGNVLYRHEDFEGAADAFQRALVSAPDDLVSRAAYNLGNARYELQEFQEALEAYQRALAADPSDLDAKRNLELALRALERQQQQDHDRQDQEQDPEDQQQEQNEEEQQPSGDDGPQRQGEEDEEEQQRQPGDESEENEGRPRAEPDPQQMTPEQAQRLLDSLADQEQENLRTQALRRVPVAASSEKDW